MRRAEKSSAHVPDAFQDYVLFLKHHLNARAVKLNILSIQEAVILMKKLRQAVSALKKELESTLPQDDPKEIAPQVVRHLEDFLNALESQNPRYTNDRVDVLQQFWLNHIPWCSELSKKVEKLLIMYEEKVKSRLDP